MVLSCWVYLRPRACNNVATKPRSDNRRGAQPRHSGRRPPDSTLPSFTVEHFKGFGVGVICGAVLTLATVLYLNREKTVTDIPVSQAVEIEAPVATPRFDFYTVLPNEELDLAADVEPANVAMANTQADLYVLQAGSFRNEKDADRRRGELVLLGLDASVDATDGENGRWFRVYIGPFESRSAMAKARSLTAQQSIDTLVLRRPRKT